MIKLVQNVLRYKLKLKTISHFIVGSGNKLSFFELLPDVKEKKIYIINTAKLLQENRNLRNDIHKLLVEGSNPSQLHKIYNNIQAQSRYSVYSLDFPEIINTNQKELNTFIRDRKNNAFIPGSTIKGALRTMMLYSALDRSNLDGPEKVSKQYIFNEKSLIRSIINNNKDDKDLMFNCIHISDSDIINNQDMEVVITRVAPVDKDTDPRRQLPIQHEAIKPGVEITFDLSLDIGKLSLIKPASNVSKAIKDNLCTLEEFLKTKAVDFIKKQIDIENQYSKLPEYNTFLSKIGDKKQEVNLRAGFGSGFLNVTLGMLYSKSERKIILKNLYNKEHRDPSPHSRKFIGQTTIGWCKVDLERLEQV